MTADIVKLPPADPIFALAPELKLHQSEIDGALVVNSREVARVFFCRRHQRLVRKIMEDIWRAPMRCRNWFRLRTDGSIDMTSGGLSIALGGWGGWGFKKKRVMEFSFRWALLVDAIGREVEAETGTNPLTQALEKFFGPMRCFTRDGRQCCDDCKQPLPAGPILHDELWTSIAEPDAFLCFDCTETRLGRTLTQADLKVCPFNAGWISFDGADVAAMQFARGRRLLPQGEVAP